MNKYASTLLAVVALSGVAISGCSSNSESAENPESYGQVTGKLRVDAPGGTIGVTTEVDFELECDGDVLKTGTIPVPLDGSGVSGHFGSVPPSNDCEIRLSTTLTLSAAPLSVDCEGSSGTFNVPANTTVNVGNILIECNLDNSSGVGFSGTIELVNQSLDTFFVGPTSIVFDPLLPPAPPVSLLIGEPLPDPGVDYTWTVDPPTAGDLAGCDATPEECQFFCEEAGTHTLRLTANFGSNSRFREVNVTCTEGTGTITTIVVETVAASGTVSTDSGSASVTVPEGGTVAITETTNTDPDPPGYSFLDQQFVITVDPPGTVANPLIFVFTVETDDAGVAVFRDGTEVPDCDDPTPGGPAEPDPCVQSRVVSGDDVIVTVRTSEASTWQFAEGDTPLGGLIRITEWMYQGTGADGQNEFVELTNVGEAPVDLTGWRYHDSGRNFAAGFNIGDLGTVQPGESVVFTDESASDFRTRWNLCEGVKVVGGSSPGLGRGDEVNIYDADGELVDRLTYNDETIGGPRTQGASGWVSADGLGQNDINEWTLSEVGDTEGSYASTGSSIGSPGKSTHGGYDPCGGGGEDDDTGDDDAPGPAVSVTPAIITGSVGDLTNPEAVLTLEDEDVTIIVESSSNESVLPLENVIVSDDGLERTVTFNPTSRGVSTVTFKVTDAEENESSVTLTYAASNEAPDASGRYHHRISDASAALDVGDGYMILVNDETNTLFLYHQEISGPPVKTWTFTSSELGTSSEIDFEGIARSGNLVVLTGSHGNNREGQVREERRTFVAATITGAGADIELTFRDRYGNLWTDLRAWDQGNGHGLSADALGFIAGTAPGVLPNPPNGFNIEALEFAPDDVTLYLGFRAPTIEVSGTYHALIVPLLDVEEDIVDGAGPASFGAPILLNLDGRSIRALAKNDHNEYLISAGPSPQNATWALYTWDGNPTTLPQLNLVLPDEDVLTGGPWECIVSVPHPLSGGQVRLVTDSGDTNFYGTGFTKDLAPDYQKSYSQLFTLAAP